MTSAVHEGCEYPGVAFLGNWDPGLAGGRGHNPTLKQKTRAALQSRRLLHPGIPLHHGFPPRLRWLSQRKPPGHPSMGCCVLGYCGSLAISGLPLQHPCPDLLSLHVGSPCCHPYPCSGRLLMSGPQRHHCYHLLPFHPPAFAGTSKVCNVCGFLPGLWMSPLPFDKAVTLAAVSLPDTPAP